MNGTSLIIALIEKDNFYAILPQGNLDLIKKYKKKNKSRMVRQGFEYSSDQNGPFLSLNELKKLVRGHNK